MNSPPLARSPSFHAASLPASTQPGQGDLPPALPEGALGAAVTQPLEGINARMGDFNRQIENISQNATDRLATVQHDFETLNRECLERPSSFSKPADDDAVKKILDLKETPYVNSSLSQRMTKSFRSYFSDTKFYEPAQTKEDDGVFEQTLSMLGKVMALLAKPKLVFNLPQARDIRVLNSRFIAEQPVPGRTVGKKTGVDISPQAIFSTPSVTPLTTLFDLLEILGKLQGRNPPGEPEVAQNTQNHQTVDEAFSNLGWHEPFFEKAMALDAVFANKGAIGFADSIAKNLMANTLRDDDLSAITTQVNAIVQDLPNAVSQTVSQLQVGQQPKTTRVEEDSEEIKKRNEEYRVRASRNKALKYLGCFTHDAKDISDCEPVRYCALNAFCINAATLRIAASVGKDLHNQRQAAKEQFLDQKFKPLNRFDFLRRHTNQLFHFTKQFNTEFLQDWNRSQTAQTGELADKITQLTNDKQTAETTLNNQKRAIEGNNQAITDYERKINESKAEINDFQKQISNLNKKSLGDQYATSKKDLENRIQNRREYIKQDQTGLQDEKNTRKLNVADKNTTEKEIKKLTSEIAQKTADKARFPGIYIAAEQKVLLNLVHMQDALAELEVMLKNFRIATKIDIRPYFLEDQQPEASVLLQLAKLNANGSDYSQIQTKLEEVHAYYAECLKEASFGGTMDYSAKLQLPHDPNSTVEQFKARLKEVGRHVSHEDYPYKDKMPDFAIRYPTDEVRKSNRVTLLEKLTQNPDTKVVDAFEKEWILPMLKASDFKHGFLKSMMWRTVVVLTGVAVFLGTVGTVGSIATTKFWQTIRYKVINGAINLVYNLGKWPEWRNSLADLANGLVDIATLPFYVIGSLASELYNEIQLLHSRVHQAVYPFLRY